MVAATAVGEVHPVGKGVADTRVADSGVVHAGAPEHTYLVFHPQVVQGHVAHAVKVEHLARAVVAGDVVAEERKIGKGGTIGSAGGGKARIGVALVLRCIKTGIPGAGTDNFQGLLGYLEFVIGFIIPRR